MTTDRFTHLPGFRTGLLCSAFFLLSCAMVSANIAGVSVANEAILVQDDGPDDLDNRPGYIKFNFDKTPSNAGYRARGTMRAFTTSGKSATTILTDVVIENLGDLDPDAISGSITFSHTFAEIAGNPLTASTASLDGQYDDVSGVGFIVWADLKFEPYANTVMGIGNINPDPVADVLNPPKTFDGTSGPIRLASVTDHVGRLSFELGFFGDAVVLPDSAIIQTNRARIIEIPTLSFLGFVVLALALAALAVFSLNRRPNPRTII